MSERVHLDFVDSRRGRQVPVSFYPPAPGTPEPWPLVLFSTGFGGGRDGYAGLARAWSAAGLAVAVLEHEGSGPGALAQLNQVPRRERAEALLERVQDPAEREARPRDLSLVLDRMAGDPRLDLDRVGLGGHSLGACTVLGAGGIPVSLGLGRRLDLFEPRARALLALSPPSPGLFFRAEDHDRLERPALLVTGTRDFGPFPESPREDRTRAFQLLPQGQAWLAVFQGADHMTFAERGLHFRPYLAPLQALTTAFWLHWLAGGPALDGDLVAGRVGGPDLVRWEER